MRTLPRLALTAAAVLAAAALVPAAQPRGDGPQPPAPPKSLAAIPRDGFVVVSVDVAQLWDNPALKAVKDWFTAQKEQTVEGLVGFHPADLDRVTVYLPAHGLDRDTGPLVLVTTRRPYNEARLVKNLIGARPDREAAERVGNVILLRDQRPFGVAVLADERTVLLLPGNERVEGATAALVAAQLLGGRTDGPLAPALAAAGSSAVTIGIDPRLVQKVIAFGPGAAGLAPYAALFRATSATLTADLGVGGVKSRLSLTFPTPDDARRAGPVLEEALADLGKLVDDEATRQGERGEHGALPEAIFGAARDTLRAAKVEVREGTVVAAADGPGDAVLTKLVAALPKQVAAARRDAEAQNNLKQILLGIHSHHDVFGFAPGDLGPDRKSAWSWRVQLLPFIEQDQIYRRLNLQLPWDDPQNKAVLEAVEMPKVFEVPGRPAPKGHTYWRSFSLPRKAQPTGGRPWLVQGEPGPKFSAIVDGLSNTIAVVEAGEAVPWYAPDVLPYDGKMPLPPLGAKGGGGFLAGMGDGTVRFVRAKTDEGAIRAAITRDGGEVQGLPER